MNSIISNNDHNKKELDTKINYFFNKNKISKLLSNSNFYKQKGFSCLNILKYIFALVFTHKNLYRHMEHGSAQVAFSKDTVYRFLNSATYNWRKFLLLLSSSIIKNEIEPLTSENRENVLIFDDSIFSRNRSKAVELLARVHDHTRNIYIKGFRMLTLGWSDGNTFMPLAFSLLSSEKERNRLCPANDKIDRRTIGFRRRNEAVKKEFDVLFDLLEDAKKHNLPADYVLFDSWFGFPSVLIKISEKYKLNTICMLKAMPRVYYTYKNKRINLSDLYKEVKKKRGKAKILASVLVGIGVDSKGNEIKAKIIFVRDRNRSRKWLALISTNIELEDEEIIRIYGKRWDIEVFFKVTKSFLNLVKEFQGRSYDLMTAHTTIVFCRYIMLSLESRNNTDQRTIGQLFYFCCDELADISYAEALYTILEALKNAVREYFSLCEDKVEEFMDFFINSLPAFLKERLVFSSCES